MVTASGLAPRWVGAWRAARGRSPLRRLELAWAGSSAGDAMAMVAFAIVAYRAGGPGGVAVLVAVQMLPSTAVAPFFAAATRRIRRERLAAAVDIGRVAMAGGAAVLATHSGRHAALLVLAAALTTANAASNVARRALMPLLVSEPSELAATSAVASTIQAASQAVGPGVAALLLTFTRTSVVLAAAAVCFAIAAIAESLLPSTAELAVQPRETERPLQTLAGGANAIRTDIPLWIATGLFAAKNLGRGALTVLVVVVALELLGLGRSGVGWLTALVGAGGVAGGAAAARLVGLRRLLPAMAVGLAVFGVPLLALAAWPLLAIAVLGLLVLGVGNTVTDVAGYTLIGRSARDDLLSSVFGVHEAIRAAAYTVGAAVAAVVADLVGSRAALVVAGALLVVAAAAGWLGRAREHPAEPQPEDLDALRASPLIGWLPPVALARIAGTVQPLELPAGTVLLREGELGDRAYLVVHGELAADQAGRVIAHMGAGDIVGEIALLRDVPRTSTVYALADSRLLAIEREEFLVAVGGNDASRQAASALVGRRTGGSPATGS